MYIYIHIYIYIYKDIYIYIYTYIYIYIIYTNALNESQLLNSEFELIYRHQNKLLLKYLKRNNRSIVLIEI